MVLLNREAVNNAIMRNWSCVLSDIQFCEILDFCVSLLQIEKEEVVLRRIIGAKKDQYFLDNKLVTYVYEYSIVERVYFTQIFITQ